LNNNNILFKNFGKSNSVDPSIIKLKKF